MAAPSACASAGTAATCTSSAAAAAELAGSLAASAATAGGSGTAAAASSSGPAAANAEEGLLQSIARLKKEQAEARASKLTISTAIKNAEKKRLRLNKRARQLSDTDLLAVITMRAQEATGSPGSAARPAPLSTESTAADDGQEFDEGHD